MNYNATSIIIKDESIAPSIAPATLVGSDKYFEHMSNTQLVVACQQRANGAIDTLLKRHRHTIVNMLYRLTPECSDTSDLIQETYIRCWQAIPLLKNPNAFKKWLRSIVTNLFYDELRRRSGKLRAISLDAPYPNDDSTDNETRDVCDVSQRPEDKVLGNELSEVLTVALSSVSEPFKTAVILRDVEGRSYEDIALITQVQIGTVKSRISRARRRVQKLVTPYLQSA